MNLKRYIHTSDNEILEHYYQSGDQHWLGILLERYTLLLLGVCMKYLKNEEEAKDAVQQVFLKTLTEAPRYKIEYFKSWIYMVAKNHCLMKLRNKSTRFTKEIQEDVAIEQEPIQKQDYLENELTYITLENCLKELNEEQKQCVTLFYLEKNSYQQIMDKTGFNAMQVKSYIQNGKRNLRLLVEKKLKLSPRQ